MRSAFFDDAEGASESGGALYAFAEAGCGAATSAPLWSYAFGSGSAVNSSSSPVIANGMLYVSDMNGVLYAFGLPHAVAHSGVKRAPDSQLRVESQSQSRRPMRPFRYRPNWAWFMLL